MYEDLIKLLRELQAMMEHCEEQSCLECKNRELCDKYDNKALSETYKEAAEAIEEMQKLNCELLFRVGQAEALIDYYQTGRMISNQPPKEET